MNHHHHQIEPPPRIAKLPKSERGYPIPFFAAVVNGKPDPRLADARAASRCARQMLCWVCGQRLDAFAGFAFVGGPISAGSHVYGDGPMHRECAEFSLKVCPHLAIPNHKRAEFGDEVRTPEGMTLEKPVSHFMLLARSFRFDPVRGLFFLDQVEQKVEWREGQIINTTQIT